MFKLTVAALAFLGYISNASYEIDCEADVACIVDDANSSTIIRANKNVPALEVTCLEAGQCKKNGMNPGLIVYSSANDSYIFCLGEDSCEETNLNFGITPPNELDSDYDSIRIKASVTCTGKQACKTITINNKGLIRNGLEIITPTDPVTGTLNNVGAFLAGTANIGDDTQGTLNCGSDADTCKDAKCFGNCNCVGTACETDFNSIPTPQPTQSPGIVPSNPPPTTSPLLPASPTPRPTPSPIDPRNSTACDVNNCILEPTDNFDVECGVQFNQCTVDCSSNSQCANGVIINALSANVKVICGAINSCDKLEIFSDVANNIIVEILAEKAAESLKIITDNDDATVTVIVEGKEGLSTGQIYCDSNCDIRCLGEDSCKDLIYECLTTSNKCLLDCDTSNNQCPIIRNFGDSSCDDTPICTVTGNGNARIIATNEVEKLTVICNENPQQCKSQGLGLRIFSAAKETILLCNNQDGCEDASVTIGALTGARVPKGFDDEEFYQIGNLNRTLVVNCDYDSSCKGLRTYAEGNIKVKLIGNGDNALQDTQSVCNECLGLNLLCREFDGCVGATIYCTNDNCGCECPFEVDIGNDTAVLATTQSPRDSCPPIRQFNPMRQNEIAGFTGENFVKNGMKSGMKIALPIIIISAVIMFCFGIIMFNYKKSYKRINGNQQKSDSQYMLKNENIYATYQVEMH